MSNRFFSWPRVFLKETLSFSDQGEAPLRYKVLRRNMIIIMALVTLVPLFLMALINDHEYQMALKNEIIVPLG